MPSFVLTPGPRDNLQDIIGEALLATASARATGELAGHQLQYFIETPNGHMFEVPRLTWDPANVPGVLDQYEEFVEETKDKPLEIQPLPRERSCDVIDRALWLAKRHGQRVKIFVRRPHGQGHRSRRRELMITANMNRSTIINQLAYYRS